MKFAQPWREGWVGLGATCITRYQTKTLRNKICENMFFFFSTIWPINHQLSPFVSNFLHQIQQLLRSTGGLLQ